MKAKVLKALADLQFEVLAYTMKDMKCSTIGQMADKLCKLYIKEDVDHIVPDLEYAYESRSQV